MNHKVSIVVFSMSRMWWFFFMSLYQFFFLLFHEWMFNCCFWLSISFIYLCFVCGYYRLCKTSRDRLDPLWTAEKLREYAHTHAKIHLLWPLTYWTRSPHPSRQNDLRCSTFCHYFPLFFLLNPKTHRMFVSNICVLLAGSLTGQLMWLSFSSMPGSYITAHIKVTT